MPDDPNSPTSPEQLRAACDVLEAELRADLRALERKYLGQGGEMEAVLRRLSEVPPEVRTEIGRRLNEFAMKVRHATHTPV